MTDLLTTTDGNKALVRSYTWGLDLSGTAQGAGGVGGLLMANAGLYHYTTQTSNAKEGNTHVDIGFHYVGVDTNGLPWDEDGDGYPDYQEDRNGNGVFDSSSGETDWGSSNTRLNTSSFLFVYTPLK